MTPGEAFNLIEQFQAAPHVLRSHGGTFITVEGSEYRPINITRLSAHLATITTSKERKYSVAEIDRMRSLLWQRLPQPKSQMAINDHFNNLDSIGRSIEDQLRTYMLNGTDPNELEIKEQIAS